MPLVLYILNHSSKHLVRHRFLVLFWKNENHIIVVERTKDNHIVVVELIADLGTWSRERECVNKLQFLSSDIEPRNIPNFLPADPLPVDLLPADRSPWAGQHHLGPHYSSHSMEKARKSDHMSSSLRHRRSGIVGTSDCTCGLVVYFHNTQCNISWHFSKAVSLPCTEEPFVSEDSASWDRTIEAGGENEVRRERWGWAFALGEERRGERVMRLSLHCWTRVTREESDEVQPSLSEVGNERRE